MKSAFSRGEAQWRNRAPNNPTQTNLMRFRRGVKGGLPKLDLTLSNPLEKSRFNTDLENGHD